MEHSAELEMTLTKVTAGSGLTNKCAEQVDKAIRRVKRKLENAFENAIAANNGASFIMDLK